jgi:serine/threonine-protein kinase
MHRLIRHQCHPHVGQHFVAKNCKYKFLGRIGDGAVGLVRKAEDLESGRTVAVKLLAPDPKYIDIAAFDDVEQRFQREGTRGARLRHENLVQILAYEENSNGSCFEGGAVKNPFIVMEYIRGGTLESLIRRLGSESSEMRKTEITKQTLYIAARVASALSYLHDLRIIHRDVKPANIFISSRTPGSEPSIVKLGDFGVTKWGDFLATAASGTLTVTRQQGLGTLKYMSPEQAVRPKDVTVRSDMFSFGITLYELFTGQLLPSPHHVFEIMSARTNRASIIGKLMSLGVKCSFNEADLFELILNMFLVAPKNRPTSKSVAGILESYYERASINSES